ncbi:MAG TPA: hypothetical protein VKV20_02420 [Ktedonobacteraceae bacterium]|jgi:hypothetical protein|nr:hypothetical protein [Ktedonobacteraceae bacterium]
MGNEAISPLVKEQAPSVYVYETVDTFFEIVAAFERILSSYTQPAALVVIMLTYENEDRAAPDRASSTWQSTTHLMQNLRPLVRKTDHAFLLDQGLYFLLLGANEQGGQIVQSRLWEALLWRVHNMNSREATRPRAMSIGHSSYPGVLSAIPDFLAEASSACLRFDLLPEKNARKATVKHSRHSTRQVENDEELPALARKLGIPYLTLLPNKLPHGVQNIVNPKLAQELHCYPIGRERNMLTVAMLNPQDRSALDRLHQETGLHIFPVLAHPQALETALEQLV